MPLKCSGESHTNNYFKLESLLDEDVISSLATTGTIQGSNLLKSMQSLRRSFLSLLSPVNNQIQSFTVGYIGFEAVGALAANLDLDAIYGSHTPVFCLVS